MPNDTTETPVGAPLAPAELRLCRRYVRPRNCELVPSSAAMSSPMVSNESGRSVSPVRTAVALQFDRDHPVGLSEGLEQRGRLMDRHERPPCTGPKAVHPVRRSRDRALMPRSTCWHSRRKAGASGAPTGVSVVSFSMAGSPVSSLSEPGLRQGLRQARDTEKRRPALECPAPASFRHRRP